MDQLYFQSVIRTLQSVTRAGAFATGGTCTMPLPSISVPGMTDPILSLPLYKAQATALKEVCTQAPYGKGTETLIDTNVRCSWQLNPDQFTITNSDWQKKIAALLVTVKEELGCYSNALVHCELYKLLFYETGGFFKPHRDTEKSKGMFGTLVIQLPSVYKGGQLVVCHQSVTKEFDFCGFEKSADFHYAAFYADCLHEIKPVTEGYRLCLVYNLVYKGSDVCPAPADHQQQVSAVVAAMDKWNDDTGSSSCPLMMAYTLEHKYSKDSTSFQALKRVDKAVAEVLIEASKEGKFDLFLCNISANQLWTADEQYETPEDLIEQDIEATNIQAPKGTCIECSFPLDEEEIVPEDFFDGEPDSEDYEGYTGNAGAELSKQYSMTAILLWPAGNRFKVFSAKFMPRNTSRLASPSEIINSLTHNLLTIPAYHFLLTLLLNQGNCEQFEHATSKPIIELVQWGSVDESSHSLLAFLKDVTNKDVFECAMHCAIVKMRKPRPYMTDATNYLKFLSLLNKPEIVSMFIDNIFKPTPPNLGFCHSFLLQLHGLGNDELFERAASLVVNASHQQISISDSLSFLSFLEDIGNVELLECAAHSVVVSLKGIQPYVHDVMNYVSLLKFFSSLNMPKIIALYLDALFKPTTPGFEFCHLFLKQIHDVGNHQLLQCATSMVIIASHRQSSVDDIQHAVSFVVTILRSLILLNCKEELSTLVATIISNPIKYPVLDVVAPALKELGTKTVMEYGPLTNLAHHSIAVIEAASKEIRPPGWSEPTDSIRCTCSDCKAMITFLQNPNVQQHRFKMGKGRRAHLHRQLDSLDVTHVTEHFGNPHTLVVTKSRKKYLAKKNKEISTLSCLRGLVKESEDGAKKQDEPLAKKQKQEICIDLTNY